MKTIGIGIKRRVPLLAHGEELETNSDTAKPMAWHMCSVGKGFSCQRKAKARIVEEEVPVKWSESIGIKVLQAREVNMKKRQVIVTLMVLGLVFSVSAVSDYAMAGETIKHHGPGVSTKWQQIEVGDQEGHVIAISETKQIYFNEKNGERFVSVASNVFDINLKSGQGSLTGYGISTYPNGDKTYRTHEGKPAGKGHWKGTWAFTKGTGKYEGVVGGGSWESKSLPSGIYYYDIKGEMELKGQ